MTKATNGSSKIKECSIMVTHVGFGVRVPGAMWQLRRSSHPLGAALPSV